MRASIESQGITGTASRTIPVRRKLGEVADVVRSKNAGPFHFTFDVIFSDPELYERVLGSGQVTRERFAATYGLAPEEVQWTVYEPGLGFKATIRRPIPSGDPRDGDVYGCQQHAPLLEWEVEA